MNRNITPGEPAEHGQKGSLPPAPPCSPKPLICQALEPGERVWQNGPMRIGYARVSTDEQSLGLQQDALAAAGCARVFADRGVPGAARARPGLAQALAALRPGDTLVVWKLDRLGRSLPHLIEVLDRVGKAGAGFLSLSEAIATTTAGGRLVFHLLGALAEFERALIAERTREGMAAAQRRGRHVGRPRALTPHQLAHARALLAAGQETRRGVAALFGVDERTLRRALARDGP